MWQSQLCINADRNLKKKTKNKQWYTKINHNKNNLHLTLYFLTPFLTLFNPFLTIVTSFLALFNLFLTLKLTLYTHELLGKRQGPDWWTNGRTFCLFNIIIEVLSSFLEKQVYEARICSDMANCMSPKRLAKSNARRSRRASTQRATLYTHTHPHPTTRAPFLPVLFPCANLLFSFLSVQPKPG